MVVFRIFGLPITFGNNITTEFVDIYHYWTFGNIFQFCIVKPAQNA